VARDDWLVGGDRRAVAVERIYAAATDLIAREGMDAFDIDVLAARVHCSRATVYRHAGGKAEIRDAVLSRSANRIIDAVRSDVEQLSGPDRVANAIILALKRIRSDPLGQLMISSISVTGEISWLTSSPLLAGFATDIAGLADGDPQAAQWLVRVVLSLMCWPLADPANDDAERQLVQRFVAPAFR
jgi:AcrR family transcriptional regulator